MKTAICYLAVALLFAFTATADIIRVPGDYPTIQQALDAANNGDDIVVDPGIYAPAYVDSLSDISIVGAGFLEPLKTVIDGGGISRGLYCVEIDKLIISGFEIRNCWNECLHVEYCKEVYILDNYLHDCNDNLGNGLAVTICENVLVKRNIIVNNIEHSLYIDALYSSPTGYWSRNISVINNTIGFTGSGSWGGSGLVQAWSDTNFTYKNNINVFNSDYGMWYKFCTQSNTSELSYNDHFGNGYGSWGGCIPDSGNIFADPQFVGGTGAEAYFLLPTSPCIDAGDPEMFDPDSTRSDIGALYYDQGPGMGLEIILTPINFPPVIPSTGGTYQYQVRIENTTPRQQIFDAWIKLTLPCGQAINPLILKQGMQLEGGEQVVRYPSLTVPFLAMPGTYIMTGFVGQYPMCIYDSSWFSFEKEPFDGPESGSTAQWTLSGWDETEHFTTPVHTPDRYDLTIDASPNPFNPETTISFNLHEAGNLSLKIFDITGREITVLYNGYALSGMKEFRWNSEKFASGIYLVKLETAKQHSVKPILLMK